MFVFRLVKRYGSILNYRIKTFATTFIVVTIAWPAPQHITAQLQLNPPTTADSSSPAFGSGEQFLQGDGFTSVLESGSVVPVSPEPDVNRTGDEFSVTPELNQVLTGIVLKNIPHQYSSDKKWGNQEKRWDGISFRRDRPGSRLETKRRYKMVNHGTWRKYSAELVDPQQQFSVELSDVKRGKDGQTQFWVNIGANLDLGARQSKWVKGVQLYSFSAEGFAKVRLSVLCDLDIGLDFSKFPPDLVLQPIVHDAKIQVDEFRLSRVSKAGGEIAQQIARRARRELDEKISEKERKLVKKLNEEIEENRDDLRISTADAVKLKWFSEHKLLLPEQVQSALTK